MPVPKYLRQIDPAMLVLLAGVSAALHVGKLAPALPALHEALGITLVQAGFLLSLVQFAGMLLGLAVGLAADGIGLKRSMLMGLSIISLASLLGGFAQDVRSLLILRAMEGFGFLLASMPAPSLIRQLVVPARMSTMLGVWGAYMPLGTALALLGGPLVIAWLGWRTWWWSLGALSCLMAVWLWQVLPTDADRKAQVQHASDHAASSWPGRLRQTLTNRGPWLVALSFAMYSGQWIALIGFLPSIYALAGLSGVATALLTALAALVNIGGNIMSGRLLGAGVHPHRLLYTGFVVMGLSSVVAFAVLPFAGGASLPAELRYGAVLLFSMVGGLIPGTLFSLAVKLAPGERTVSTTVGWTQQWAATGQFAGPPLVAWVASAAGGWQLTWIVTGSCSLLGLLLAWQIGCLHGGRT
ncbi:MAG: MFS transporter [Gammaproteobacteria bacterium]|nr:MFS transporter [Gammaproteobacteria bacterium]MBU0786933.1 MFS transporter [Gammaproteobacteria bacterium]MBU0813861.1 MFS transporter [Gammaproteobacteria bacterium]MBU1788666.1 MFS transporter [Gammaproteobacteria bacterium]